MSPISRRRVKVTVNGKPYLVEVGDLEASPITVTVNGRLYLVNIEAAAEKFDPHQVAFYLRDLAADFHTYYNAHQFIITDAELRDARLLLIQAVRQVLNNGLKLLGMSAPERM